MPLRARPSSIVVWLWLAVAATGLPGCGPRGADPVRDFYDTADVPLSADLRGAVAEWRRAAGEGGQLPSAGSLDVAAYERLAVDIQRPASRQAAGDSLYARWQAAPTHFLWIDLAATYNYLLRRQAQRNAMYARPPLADTTGAVGAFVQGRRYYRYGSRGEAYRRAGRQAAALDPLSRAWLELKLALVDADSGQALGAVRRLLDRLPAARAAGGARLAGLYWRDMSLYLQRADRLDDALHAAAVAGALAVKCGAPERALAVRMQIAGILAARRESEAALAQYDSCLALAGARDFPWLVTDGLNREAALCGALGDTRRALAYDRRSVAHSRAMNDSLNAPRNMMNVAHDLRLLGELDSCLVWQRRARAWVEAFHDARNLARLPQLEAEYWCEVGDYRAADSLLALARGRLPGAGLALDEAELLLDQIRQGRETGRPGLAYRAIARLRDLRPVLYDRLPDRNLVADYEIATAEFLAGQGELQAADEALARARSALESRGGEARLWEYQRALGELARRREDPPTARRAFEACVELAGRAGDPERLARSRFLLGRALLDDGRAEAARVLFAEGGDSSFGGAFRTRLSVLIFRGVALGREGRGAEALVPLRRAAALCTPFTPPDLVARLRIETGRALAARGEAPAAEAELLRALETLRRVGDRLPMAELEAFADPARRDLAEALIGLYCDFPALLKGRDVGAATLPLLGGLLRGEPGVVAGGRVTGPHRGPAPGATPAPGPRLDFFVGRDRSYRWLTTPAGVTLSELPGRAGLRDLVLPLLTDMQQPGRGVEAAVGERLGRQLLGAVAAAWPDGAALTIVPDDLLAALPWAALPLPAASPAAGSGLVLERGPVIEALDSPSPAPPRPAADRTPPSSGTLLAIGDDRPVPASAGGPALSSLRHAEAEARRIAALWPPGRGALRLGGAGDPPGGSRAGEDWSAYGVIHLATHAVVHQGGPDRSTLWLAGREDGLPLTIPDVASLRLRADLVYLSCCEAATRLAGGGVTDFARAFARAGARTIIASTIPVDDEAAGYLAERFYVHWLSGMGRAAALRAAQLDTRTRPAWGHPAYWAFYRLMGEGD
jgi:hypothetical protein